jgi:hypothetical protein
MNQDEDDSGIAPIHSSRCLCCGSGFQPMSVASFSSSDRKALKVAVVIFSIYDESA